MVEGGTQMSIAGIEVENVAGVEVVRMTEFVFGTVLGGEVEFAVVLGAEVEIVIVAGVEVVRMTEFVFGTVLGGEVEFAVVLGAEVEIVIVAGVEFGMLPVTAMDGTVAGVKIGIVFGNEVGPETVNLTGFEFGNLCGTGFGIGIVGQFDVEIVGVPVVGKDIVAGLEAGMVSVDEAEAGPKEQHNYYMAAVSDFQDRFGKHKDIPGSIKSCSLVVLTGAGGSGKANALHGLEVEAAGTYEVVGAVLLIGTIPSLVPADVL
ncbi:hypothetical protein POUND7_019874 [Theobroma cacao]